MGEQEKFERKEGEDCGPSHLTWEMRKMRWRLEEIARQKKRKGNRENVEKI